MLKHGSSAPRCADPPLISIVMPFLDAEPFIAEAIESVLGQSVGDWELLLVDDGCGDRSTRIAQGYAASDPKRIRYLVHPDHRNLGQGASRNLGLEHAGGRYVTFLDADDVFLPSKLETQAGILNERPDLDLVFGNTLYWHSWNDAVNPHAVDWLPSLGIPFDTALHPPELLPLVLGTGGAAPCVCSLMVKRSTIEALGRFDARINRLYEDQALMAKLFLHHVAWFHQDYLEKYRQRSDSTWQTSVKNGNDKAARRDYLEWLQTYAKCVDAIDPAHQAAIRSELSRTVKSQKVGLKTTLLRLIRSLKHAAPLKPGAPQSDGKNDR